MRPPAFLTSRDRPARDEISIIPYLSIFVNWNFAQNFNANLPKFVLDAQ